MKGYTTSSIEMMKHMARYKGPEEPHIIEIASLRVMMPGEGVKKLYETPHFQYTLGYQEPYKMWLIQENHLYESSLASFEYLMNDDTEYLGEGHEDDFIIHKDDMVIFDGVHRATRLFQLGVIRAPVLRKVTP